LSASSRQYDVYLAAAAAAAAAAMLDAHRSTPARLDGRHHRPGLIPVTPIHLLYRPRHPPQHAASEAVKTAAASRDAAIPLWRVVTETRKHSLTAGTTDVYVSPTLAKPLRPASKNIERWPKRLTRDHKQRQRSRYRCVGEDSRSKYGIPVFCPSSRISNSICLVHVLNLKLKKQRKLETCGPVLKLNMHVHVNLIQ